MVTGAFIYSTLLTRRKCLCPPIALGARPRMGCSGHRRAEQPPTAAVANIASIPQMVTLAAPTSTGAPPIRAATAPSATRQNTDTTETAATSAVAGVTRIVTMGTPALTANVAADATMRHEILAVLPIVGAGRR